MITLKFMRYLTVAVRCGSISEAALELNISASAISAAIDQIEEHFKLKLVTRQRARGIKPTSSGREMIKKFQTLLDDYDEVMSEGVELKEAMTGHLHIGYYSPVAPSFLPQIISDIIPERGSLSLHLEECDNDAA
ncbi:MAG: LysR family transcriptional regulator, partial [Amylibacter sp.]